MKDTTTETYRLADHHLAQLMGFNTPRRPRKWGKVVQAYLDLDQDARDAIGRAEVQNLIDWFAPGAKKKRQQEERRRKDAKAKAKKVRNLPENKNQEWSHPANRNWSHTGDIDDDGKDEVRVHVKKPRIFTSYQYDPERVVRKLLDALNTGEKELFFTAIAKEINKDLSSTRLKTSYGSAAYEGEEGLVNEATGSVDNNPEFSEGFAHGALPVPGKKISGNARKLLGERDDKALDKGVLDQASPEFKALWAKDQAEVKNQEAEERKAWRKTVGA